VTVIATSSNGIIINLIHIIAYRIIASGTQKISQKYYSSPITQNINMQVSQRHAISTLLLVLASLSSFSEGFGIGPIRQGFLGSTVSDFAESVNGEVHLETIMEELNQTESNVSIEKEETISPVARMAPPLTYRKFLTMQV
jgi:hypothetical protein